MNACETARITLEADTQGRTWEHYWLGQHYQFSNQIPNRQSFTRTAPGWIIADSALCQWQGPPPARITEIAAAPPIAPAPTTASAGGEGAMGILLLLGLAGAGVWAWLTRDQTIDSNYHPLADAPALPALGGLFAELSGSASPPTTAQGNSSHGIPTVEAIEFDGNSHEFEWNSQEPNSNSHEFERNSQNDPDANSLGILGVPADSQDWPPKQAGPIADPLQPEQAGEFDVYRKRVDQDGLNPRGNDIIKAIWGVTPGRSAAYEAARRRRDDFAKRLEYYRYEEA